MIDTTSPPAEESRARSAVAPPACRPTPSHEKGASGRSGSLESRNATDCTTASISAGCRPNMPASRTSPGSATSTNTSPGARHTRRIPWNTGPYSDRS